jgi:hypothetical protein
MKTFVKCKACGFVMEAQKVGNVCPACGVPSKMFEPYVDKVSEQRKRILDLHIHPVIVHAPQAFAFFLLFFSVVALFINGTVKNELLIAIKILAFCLPFTLVGSVLSGMLDGKTRFRRYTTPILRRKTIVGVVFFVLSVLLMVVTQASPVQSVSTVVLMVLLSAGCLVCSMFLGLLGTSLLDAKFPG